MSIRIPRDYQAGIKKALELADEEFQELFDLLHTLKPAPRREIGSRIADQVHRLKKDEIAETVDALFSIYLVRSKLGLSTTDLANAIVRSKDLSVPSSQIDRYTQRLEKLLSLDGSLGISAKAVEVLTERPHVLCNARLFSDVRPVFGESPAQPPAAAVLLHTLKLSYYESGQVKEFFIDLDSSDLVSLKELLTRAEVKEESLKRLLDSASWLCLDTKEEK